MGVGLVAIAMPQAHPSHVHPRLSKGCQHAATPPYSTLIVEPLIQASQVQRPGTCPHPPMGLAVGCAFATHTASHTCLPVFGANLILRGWRERGLLMAGHIPPGREAPLHLSPAFSESGQDTMLGASSSEAGPSATQASSGSYPGARPCLNTGKQGWDGGHPSTLPHHPPPLLWPGAALQQEGTRAWPAGRLPEPLVSLPVCCRHKVWIRVEEEEGGVVSWSWASQTSPHQLQSMSILPPSHRLPHTQISVACGPSQNHSL